MALNIALRKGRGQHPQYGPDPDLRTITPAAEMFLPLDQVLDSVK